MDVVPKNTGGNEMIPKIKLKTLKDIYHVTNWDVQWLTIKESDLRDVAREWISELKNREQKIRNSGDEFTDKGLFVRDERAGLIITIDWIKYFFDLTDDNQEQKSCANQDIINTPGNAMAEGECMFSSVNSSCQLNKPSQAMANHRGNNNIHNWEDDPRDYCFDCSVYCCWKDADGRYHYIGSTIGTTVRICNRVERRKQ